MNEEKPVPQRVTWGFEILPESIFPEYALNNPSEQVFQISLPDYQAAERFIAEMQRFLGNLMLRQGELSEKRIAEAVVKQLRGENTQCSH